MYFNVHNIEKSGVFKLIRALKPVLLIVSAQTQNDKNNALIAY